MRIFKFIYVIIFGGAWPVVRFHLEIMSALRQRGWHRLGGIVANRLQRRYGIFISPKAKISPTMSLRHPIGVVIGDGVKIGQRVIIYQNVTIGGARLGDGEKSNYPTIGDDTVIFAGAAIVGQISIGRNCVIGANAVVTRDIPDNCTAVGVPARVITNAGKDRSDMALEALHDKFMQSTEQSSS